MQIKEAIEKISKLKEQAVDNFNRARQLLEASIRELEEKKSMERGTDQAELKENITRLKEFNHQLQHLETSINIHHRVTLDVFQASQKINVSHTLSNVWEGWGNEAFSTGGHIAARHLLTGIPAEGKQVGEMVFIGGVISIAIRVIIEKIVE